MVLASAPHHISSDEEKKEAALCHCTVFTAPKEILHARDNSLNLKHNPCFWRPAKRWWGQRPYIQYSIPAPSARAKNSIITQFCCIGHVYGQGPGFRGAQKLNTNPRPPYTASNLVAVGHHRINSSRRLSPPSMLACNYKLTLPIRVVRHGRKAICLGPDSIRTHEYRTHQSSDFWACGFR